MTRENAQQKGRRYLCEGRVVVTHVNGNQARAIVRGDGHLYRVTANGPAWSCTCPARTRCAHQIAVGCVIAVDYPDGAP